MSLITPVLIAPPAFDATQAYTFTFNVGSGGNQVTGNTITIYDNITNEEKYSHTETDWFQYTNRVPANALENNTYYNAKLYTVDAQGEQSSPSIPVQFWCYTQPTLSLNVTSGQIINNSTYPFQITYQQAESEAINSFVFNLYDKSKVLLATSGRLYASSGSPSTGIPTPNEPFTASFTFTGFQNNVTYNIQATAITVQNTQIETDFIEFRSEFIPPASYSVLQLVNNCDAGYITVQSNIQLIEGTSNPSPPTYIGGTEVDLTATGSWAAWTQGYTITGNVLDRIWFRNPTPNTTILSFANVSTGQTITIQYCEGYVDDDRTTTKMAYFTLSATSILLGGSTSQNQKRFDYFIYSDYTTILPSTIYYCLWITRVNDIYQLQVGTI